jgi:hypothetical protein
MAEVRNYLDVGDILSIRFECDTCGTAVAIAPSECKGVPYQCPNCTQTWALSPTGSQQDPVYQFVTALGRMLKDADSSRPPRMPYRIRLEIADRKQ